MLWRSYAQVNTRLSMFWSVRCCPRFFRIFNCKKRVFLADFKSYWFKTDGRNSWFEKDAVEDKDRRRGARKLCCGASILFVTGVCVYIWEGQQGREWFCYQEIEGAASKFQVNRILVILWYLYLKANKRSHKQAQTRLESDPVVWCVLWAFEKECMAQMAAR